MNKPPSDPNHKSGFFGALWMLVGGVGVMLLAHLLFPGLDDGQGHFRHSKRRDRHDVSNE